MKKIIKAHKGYMHVSKPSSEQAPSKAKGTAGATPRRRSIGLPQQFRGGRNKRQTELNNLRLDRAPNIEQIRDIFNTSNIGAAAASNRNYRNFKDKNTSGLKQITSKDIKSQLTPKQLKVQRDAYERQRRGLPPVTDPRTDNYRDDRTPRRASAPVPKAPPMVTTRSMQEPKKIKQPKPVVRPPKIMDGEGGRDIRGISVGRPPPVFELPNKGRGKNIRRPKPQVRSAQAPRTPVVGKPISRIMNQGGYISRAKYGIVNNLNKNK